MDFRTSINIGYDIGNESFLRGYLPTPSHAESIIGISEGFTEESSNSAHILVGPYGSGKSLLATILASIVSQEVSQSSIDAIIQGFNNVHQTVHDSLVLLKDVKRKYIPVTMNGSYEDFADALLANIQKELEVNGYKIELPTERNNILKTINRWKTEYSSTYELFDNELTTKSKRAKTIEQWIVLIQNGNKEEIEWFKTIYGRLTSGAEFESYTDGNLQESLDIILKVLKANKLGIFLVHDEFGRFLQGLDQNKINKTMQDLQDIAEFVNRTNGHVHLLLISHRSMSRYMVGFYEEYQSEFERIEKRYSSYYVESDSATYYRIVQRYIATQGLNQDDNRTVTEKQNISLDIKSYNLFEELNEHEVDNLVVKGSYPIHPVTLFMLPRISRVFGQNERTLFTYLTSTETHSFQNQLKKNEKYVYADTLFQYFFSERSLNDIYDEATSEIIRLYLSIRSNLDARKTNAYRVIRFITLWELTNSNNLYKLNEEIISFATGINRSDLENILTELIELKFVRLNRVQNKIELAEGSSVVIDELIDNRKIDLKINDDHRLELLYKALNKRFYLARYYNDQKNITRFMRTQIIFSADFIKGVYSINDLISSQADGTIIYIILNKKSDYTKVEKIISQIKDLKVIFAVLKNKVGKVEKNIDNLIAIKSLKSDEKLLHEYKGLNNELEIYYENYYFEIEQFLSSFTDFKDTVEWYHCGRPIILKNELELEDTVSNIMWKLYSKTPVIMNDAINRFNVFGIQKRSLLSFMDKVLNSYEKENIGIEGHGPEYLIYATLIKNLEIDLLNLDNIGNVDIQSIRSDILHYLEQHEEGKLIELYNILGKTPYGLRPPLIPVFLVILLREKWSQLVFYRNKMFVPANDGEKIYEMFKEPEKYEYVFQNFSAETTLFLNKLEDQFTDYISENVLDESQVIKVSSGLLNWLRSLPRQTQITHKFTNERLNKLKGLVRKSEVNPLHAIEELIQLYEGDLSYFEVDVNLLTDSYIEFKSYVENKFCDILGLKEFNSKDDFYDKWDKEQQVKNNLLSTLIKAETVEEFSYNYIGTEMKDWSDINYDLFINQLNSDYKNLFEVDDIDEDTYELHINDTYKQIKKVDLSKKSEVIYNNMERMINNAGRTVSKDEMNYMLLKLINEHID